MDVGPAVDDVWAVTACVRAWTREKAGSVGWVEDEDGEFVLIEGAEVIPDWVDPESSKNRVFWRGGQLVILTPEDCLEVSTRAAGASLVAAGRGTTLPLAQELAGARIARALDQKMHWARYAVPIRAARLLAGPWGFAPLAVAALADDTPEPRHKRLPLVGTGPVIEIGLELTRLQYALLTSRKVSLPQALLAPEGNADEAVAAAADRGARLCLGLEMAYTLSEGRSHGHHLAMDAVLSGPVDFGALGSCQGRADDSDDWMNEDPLAGPLSEAAAPTEQELASLSERLRSFASGKSGVEGVSASGSGAQADPDGVEIFDPDKFMAALAGTLGITSQDGLPDLEKYFFDEDEDDEDDDDSGDGEVGGEGQGLESNARSKVKSNVGPEDEQDRQLLDVLQGPAPGVGEARAEELDLNLIENLVKSFEHEHGGHGPASSLFESVFRKRKI